MDGRIFQLKYLLSEKLDHDWTVEEMAEIVELSVPHFQKLFKANLGVPPMAYLHDIRLEKACESLKNSFRRLKQIGIEVGITDNSHFTRDFKGKFGVTPTEYRKQYWEKVQTKTTTGNE